MEEAEKYLSRGIEFLERVNEKAWNMVAHGHLGDTYFAMGYFPEAKNNYEKGYRGLEQTQAVPSWGNWAKVGWARSKVMNKEKDVDLESLYAHSRNNKLKAVEGWISRHIGEILLNIDDLHMAEAENWIQKSIEADQGNGIRFQLGNDYALYAEWFKRKGDRLKAQEKLGTAIEILKECGADGWVSKYQKELALLS